jgi:hypothetical protein
MPNQMLHSQLKFNEKFSFLKQNSNDISAFNSALMHLFLQQKECMFYTKVDCKTVALGLSVVGNFNKMLRYLALIIVAATAMNASVFAQFLTSQPRAIIELATNQVSSAYPFLTDNGLTVYWVKGTVLYSATRPALSSNFALWCVNMYFCEHYRARIFNL